MSDGLTLCPECGATMYEGGFCVPPEVMPVADAMADAETLYRFQLDTQGPYLSKILVARSLAVNVRNGAFIALGSRGNGELADRCAYAVMRQAAHEALLAVPALAGRE